MTGKKWTPGPWRLISDADDDWGMWSACNAKNPLDHICDVADYPNARLIAAAPDLYDALELAADRMAENGLVIPSVITHALAKARGK